MAKILLSHVYLIEDCDGFGHNILRHAASCYLNACEWCRANGASEPDSIRTAAYPHDPSQPGSQDIAKADGSSKFFCVTWVPIDAEYVRA